MSASRPSTRFRGTACLSSLPSAAKPSQSLFHTRLRRKREVSREVCCKRRDTRLPRDRTGMPTLIDTHTWLWWVTEDRRLSKTAAAGIARAQRKDDLWYSLIS